MCLRVLVGGRLEVRLLRGIRAGHVEDDDIVIAGSGLQALLAILSLAVPNAVSSDRLIDELWGDEQPGNPENALQARISKLRHTLGRDAVVRRETGYALAVAADDVDALRLERLVREGRDASARGDHQGAATRHHEALTLLSTDPFHDLADYRFARVAASRVDELALAAHEGLADARLALGKHADTVGPLIDLVREHPLRERFHAQLMLALYRCGRQADALRAYQSARDVLVEEFGLEPGAELQALEQGVLTHDPALSEGVSFVPPMPQPTSLPAKRDLAAWRADAGIDDGQVTQLPFVGRVRELRDLHTGFDEVLDGSGRIMLLEGEPGIGKTRLVEELAAHAADNGATVVWSRCYEGRGAPAFWPWTQVLHRLCDRVAPDELRAAIGPHAPELVQIAPELKELFESVDPAAPLDPDAARFRIHQAVNSTLRRLARHRSVLVVLDDLHWADEASMELLAFVAGELRDVHLGVAATYRSVDPTISLAMSGLLSELSRRAAVRRLTLAGLDHSDLRQFLSVAGAAPADDLIATIEERTRGNPFFITEILRLLPSTGAPDARTIGRVVPANVKGVIRRRVAQLPAETGHTLAAASVLGHDFDLSLLSTIVETDGAALFDQLEPAMIAGLVVDSPDGLGRYRFSHGLVHEAIYDDMGVAQRARTHRRVGEALEARFGDADGAHLLPMAEHWYRAVPIAPAEKGIDVACRAALWALGHVAHQQAEEQLHAALDLVATILPSPDRARLELSILDQLSMALVVNTSYTGAEIAVVAARSRALCDEIDDPARLVPPLWRLATHHMMRGEIDTGLTVGHELLTRGTAGASLPSATLAGHMCLGILLTQRGDIVDARRHLDTAIEMCDAGLDAPIVGRLIEEPAVFARVFSSINWWLLGDEAAAEEHVTHALAIGSREGPQTYSTTLALWGASMISLLRGDAATTLQRSKDGVEQATIYGYPLALHVHGVTRGWALAKLGETADGVALIREHADAFFALGSVYLRHFYLALLAEAYLMGGMLEDAHESVDAGLDIVATAGEAWYEAELHRLRGEALVAADRRDPLAADSFRTAIAVATAQGAHGLLRRAQASLRAVAPA